MKLQKSAKCRENKKRNNGNRMQFEAMELATEGIPTTDWQKKDTEKL